MRICCRNKPLGLIVSVRNTNWQVEDLERYVKRRGVAPEMEDKGRHKSARPRRTVCAGSDKSHSRRSHLCLLNKSSERKGQLNIKTECHSGFENCKGYA